MYYQSYFVAKKKNIKHLKMLKKNPHQYIIFTKANAEEKKNNKTYILCEAYVQC